MTQSVSFAQESRDDSGVRKVCAAWVDAMNAKDSARLLSMVTDDVVFLPPGLSIITGKKAVEAMYAAFFPQFSKVELQATIVELRIAGDWAFAWGNEILTLMPAVGGAPIQARSRGMSILARQSDGSWKFARAMNQPDTPAQAPFVDPAAGPKK
jgi:uncharacterized protein (TIGR02246 family)